MTPVMSAWPAATMIAGVPGRQEHSSHPAAPHSAVPIAYFAWRSHLETNGIEIESEVTWPRGGRSLYVRDPAGNSVELASPTIWGFDG